MLLPFKEVTLVNREITNLKNILRDTIGEFKIPMSKDIIIVFFVEVFTGRFQPLEETTAATTLQ